MQCLDQLPLVPVLTSTPPAPSPASSGTPFLPFNSAHNTNVRKVIQVLGDNILECTALWMSGIDWVPVAGVAVTTVEEGAAVVEVEVLVEVTPVSESLGTS